MIADYSKTTKIEDKYSYKQLTQKNVKTNYFEEKIDFQRCFFKRHIHSF